MITQYTDVLFEKYDDPAFNIYAEGNYVHHNAFSGNGTEPDGLISTITKGKIPAQDILLDGCIDPMVDNSDNAKTNCFFENDGATYLNFDLCGGFADQSEDLAPVTCEHAPLTAPM